MSEKETDILARTIYGEARGESISGMEAVASVVLNRVAFANRRGRFWWGNSIAEVCRAPKQFSCWNRNDPNYRLICRVADTFAKGLPAARLPDCWKIKPTGLPTTMPVMFGRIGLREKFPVPKSVAIFSTTILKSKEKTCLPSKQKDCRSCAA